MRVDPHESEGTLQRSRWYMKRFVWPALAAAMIALIAASLIWLKDLTPFGPDMAGGETPNIALRLDDAELVGWQGGMPAWRFQARQVEVSSDRVHTTFRDIAHGSVYNDGKPAIVLSGKRVVYNTFTHDIEAAGDIKAKAGEDLSISTNKLMWNAYQQKLTCPHTLTLVTAAGKGTARSLTADLKNDTIELVQARIRFPVEEEMFR